VNVKYPYQFDRRKRTAETAYDDHIREMIEQVLFTAPGERVNRVDFGTGLMELVFAGNSDELATATQFLVQGALERWLGELIQIEAIRVTSEASMISITVQYIVQRTQEQRVDQFDREVTS
jgi:phage baseplate assembly protein W